MRKERVEGKMSQTNLFHRVTEVAWFTLMINVHGHALTEIVVVKGGGIVAFGFEDNSSVCFFILEAQCAICILGTGDL